MKKILVVCPAPRDSRELICLPQYEEYSFIFHEYSSEQLEKLIYEEGHEEGRADSTQEILTALIELAKKEEVAGVISSDDYPGSTFASIIAHELNLPGPHPETMLLCQHKYYSRIAQQELVPEAVPKFALVCPVKGELNGLPLALPFFLKPVKSYFSCFANVIDSKATFASCLSDGSLPPRSFLQPFHDLLLRYTALQHDPYHLIAEELLEGIQGTVEGYVFDGVAEIFGVSDSIMFPGTTCFQRFQYPSQLLSQEVQERVGSIAKRCMLGIGFNNGLFNIEFFYNPETGKITIIEINPRVTSQFADMYEKVDGTNSYEVLLSIATGKKPLFRRRQGKYKMAFSCVLRELENKYVRKIPDDEAIEAVKKLYPDLRVEIFAREGKRLSHELQDGKSYRYGLISIGADSTEECEQQLEHMLGGHPQTDSTPMLQFVLESIS